MIQEQMPEGLKQEPDKRNTKEWTSWAKERLVDLQEQVDNLEDINNQYLNALAQNDSEHMREIGRLRDKLKPFIPDRILEATQSLRGAIYNFFKGEW